MLTALQPAAARPAIPAVSNGPAQPATPAVPAQPGERAERGPAVDVIADVEERKARHVGYQVLRRTFQLEEPDAGRGRTPRPAERSDTAPTAPGDGTSARPPARDAASDPQGLQRRFEQARAATGSQVPTGPQRSDPLVLDLGGEGLRTTGLDGGAHFDITGDGRLEHVSFVAGDTWFLALDRNGNGVIDDGRELFGDQHGAANGFEELARFDGNGDGVIDGRDEVFEQLRLFQLDAAGSQQLLTLAEAGVSAIRLDYRNTQKALNDYDLVAQVGRFLRDDGSEGLVADLLLGYRAVV